MSTQQKRFIASQSKIDILTLNSAPAGDGLEIFIGEHNSPFGPLITMVLDDRLCALAFTDGGPASDITMEELKARWPKASYRTDPKRTQAPIRDLFRKTKQGAQKLALIGSEFEIKVWKALLQVPSGTVTSYSEIAKQIGNPAASRAVGSAIGRNPIALIVPCHRVLRKDGKLGGYRWGTARKQMILKSEAEQARKALD